MRTNRPALIMPQPSTAAWFDGPEERAPGAPPDHIDPGQTYNDPRARARRMSLKSEGPEDDRRHRDDTRWWALGIFLFGTLWGTFYLLHTRMLVNLPLSGEELWI